MPIHIVGGGRPAPAGSRRHPQPGLSLCMIVRDEEALLDTCLTSACAVVDEICIVDTGSLDRTLEIARAYGAKVREIPWTDDFSEARNASLEMATRRWVLFLDADEVLKPESIPLIRSIVASEPQRVGFNFHCINEVDDHGSLGQTSHLVLRLFPNDPEIRFVQPLHEYVSDPQSTLPGKVLRSATVEAYILHRGYLDAIVRQKKKPERNLAIALSAVEKYPDDPFHWYGLGQTYAFMGRRADAKEPFERMRSCASPDDKRGIIAHGLAVLAEIYSQEEQYELAEQRARESLERSPGYPNAYFSLGQALRKAGRAEEAIAAFRAACADGIDPKNFAVVDDQVYQWKARCELGVYLSSLQRHDAAIAAMEEGIARAPGAPALRINYAHVLEQAGQIDAAERAFGEAFARHPAADTALQNVNYLLRRGRRNEAMSLLEQAIGRVESESERGTLLDAQVQLSAQVAAAELARQAADVASSVAHLSPEAQLRQRIGHALQGDDWAQAAGLLLMLSADGVEEDRLRVLCAYRLGESDTRAAGLLAAVVARSGSHLEAVVEAICLGGHADTAADLQGAVAVLAGRLLAYGRSDEARRVVDVALAVPR
ncbi:glycosyltransferase [bacterium]|nr:MAG: glycosyltransferase [bacterium]